MILESSAAEATRRLRDPGVTVCQATIVSQDPYVKMMPHYCISVDGEDIFIKGRVNADDVTHLVVDLQFQRRHRAVKMNAVEIVHN
jgi:hypothetical protein